MKLFGPLHLTILAIIAILTGILAALCRRYLLPVKATRRLVGAAIAVNEVIWWTYRYSREGIHTDNLPLQLCDAAVWLAVLACFTDAPLVLELAYFPGMAGAAMALLTPNLWSPWPSYPAVYFFLAHGGIVVAVAVTIFGTRHRFPGFAVWRSFGLLLIYAGIVGLFDRFTGADYMFLRQKPEAASLLDQMGPWPWYIATSAALALVLFWLLWLPVRGPRPAKVPAPVSPHARRRPSNDEEQP